MARAGGRVPGADTASGSAQCGADRDPRGARERRTHRRHTRLLRRRAPGGSCGTRRHGRHRGRLRGALLPGREHGERDACRLAREPDRPGCVGGAPQGDLPAAAGHAGIPEHVHLEHDRRRIGADRGPHLRPRRGARPQRCAARLPHVRQRRRARHGPGPGHAHRRAVDLASRRSGSRRSCPSRRWRRAPRAPARRPAASVRVAGRRSSRSRAGRPRRSRSPRAVPGWSSAESATTPRTRCRRSR